MAEKLPRSTKQLIEEAIIKEDEAVPKHIEIEWLQLERFRLIEMIDGLTDLIEQQQTLLKKYQSS